MKASVLPVVDNRFYVSFTDKFMYMFSGTIIGLIILAVGFQLAAENHASLNTTIVERDINGSVIIKCLSKYK